MDPNKLDPSQPFKGGPATNRPKENANIHHTTPTPVEPTNISMMPFPPPVDSEGLKNIANTINLYAMLIIAGLGVIWFFTAFRGAGWKSFLFFSEIIGAVALCVFFAHGLVIRKIEKEFESIRQYMHQQRGEEYVPPTPEYVFLYYACFVPLCVLVARDLVANLAVFPQIDRVAQRVH